MTRRVLLLTTVALVGVTGAAIAGPATKGAPKGVTAYINHGNGALSSRGYGFLPQNIWPPPGALVAAVSVPAGSFVVNAKIRLTNHESDSFAAGKCLLRGAKGKQIDAANWRLEPSDHGYHYEAISLQGTSSTASKGGFSLWCAYHGSKKVMAESQVLTAVRVSKIDEQ